MYCEACQRMLNGKSRRVSPRKELSPSFLHHVDGGSDLYNAAIAGCCLCKFIWGMLSHNERAAVCDEQPNGKALLSSYQIWKSTDKTSFKILYWLQIRRKSYLVSGELYHLNRGEDSVQKEISVLPNDIAGWDTPVQHVNSSKTWCTATSLLAKQWLEVCDTSHPTCKAMCRSGWHPTRLVFVGTTSQPALRICLRSHINQNDRYVTLSHCWGLKKFFNLKKSNYLQCLEQFQLEDLPQTFQDAIRITRDLDTKYIWIDSLCIIQDSLDDWAKESLEMAEVYSYSYCTIAATAASDGSEGCIRTRQGTTSSLRHKQHPRKPLFGLIPRRALIYPRSFAASETGVFKSLPEGNYQFMDPMLWEREVTLSPLSKRAWVLQETVLSRRTLYFCSDQLFFGCSSAGFCEDYPQGFPETIKIYKEMQPLIMNCGWSKIDVKPSSPSAPSWTEHGIRAVPFALGLGSVTFNHSSSYLECWNTLLQDYCKRAITNPQDKLIAISGLASRIHAITTSTAYFAGIWLDENDVLDRKLLGQLLWQHAKPSGRLPTYIAPTWSWASVQGEISIDDFLLPECQQPLASILDISVDPVGENSFAQISSGFICLKGPLLPGKLTVDREFVRVNDAYIDLLKRMGALCFEGSPGYISKEEEMIAVSRYMRLQDRLFPNRVGVGVNKGIEFFSITLDMDFSKERRQFHPDSDSMVTNMALFCMPISRDHIINDEEIPSCVIRGLVLAEVPSDEHSTRSVLKNENRLHNQAGGRIFERVGIFYEYCEFFPLWNALYGQSEEIVTII